MTPCSSLTVPTSGSVRDFNPKDSTHAGRTDKPKLGTGVSCLGIGSGLSFGLEAAASALLGGIELDVAINNKDIALDLL